MPSAEHHAPDLRAPRRSLRWRLPLVIGAVMVLVLSTFLWSSYRTVESTLLRTGGERAQSAADQLAMLFAQSTAQALDALHQMAANPAIVACLRQPTDETQRLAREALGRLGPGGPQQVVELWNDTHSRLVAIATPAAAADVLPSGTAPVAAGIRELQAARGTVFSEAVADVTEGSTAAHTTEPAGGHLGYLVVRRAVVVSPTPDVLNRLIGRGALVEVGNQTGGVWTDLSRMVPAPPLDLARTGFTTYRAADGVRHVSAAARIAGTPWAVWVDFRQSVLTAPALGFLQQMLVVGALFVAVAIALIWKLTARVTTPLAQLTEAASAIAAGTYSRRVAMDRADEIGRLGQAFDTMADQVKEAYARVEARASELAASSETARRLAAIVESSHDAIIREDLDGTILTWNRGAERLYGYSAGEISGRSIAVLLPDGDATELRHHLMCVRAGTRVDHYETFHRTRDGRLVNVSLTVSPIRDTDTGPTVGASTIARDITARTQAEQALRDSEARLRSIFNSAIDGIIVIDDRGIVETFNPAAEQLFGYTADQVIGHNVRILMPAPYRDEHDQYLARYLATGERQIIGIGREVEGRRQDGRTFPLHLSVGEMVVGGKRKFTGMLHDLTARVEMEERLRDQSALARLGEMAAVIAHEVKNPLAGVRGAIQVIGDRLSPSSRDAVIVKEIVARIDGLNDLMKDLLLFARPPQPHPALVDVVSLLEMTAALVHEDASLKEVRIDVAGTAPPIVADAELLKIVFHNLLVNGAHAMRGAGKVRVAVASADRFCEIAISDTGPGIPPDVRQKIFTPFFTTKTRGSGLGLPTAKRLIEAHQGRIVVDCPAAGGTTVTVQLPVAMSSGSVNWQL